MKRIKTVVCLATLALVLAGLALIPRGGATQGLNGLRTPTGLEASDNVYSQKVGLYWRPVRDGSLYRIFRGVTNDPSAAIDIGTTQANTFFDMGAAAGQVFFYWVRAENGTDSSEMSAPDTGIRSGTPQQGPVPPLEPPPVPPGNPVTASKAYLGKTLFWDEQLSSTRTVSCGTCHHAGTGGVDPRSITAAAGAINPGPDGVFDTNDDIRGSGGVPQTAADGSYVHSSDYGFDHQVTRRRSMSYINSAYAPVLFWDGRATQIFRDPLTDAVVLGNGAALESQALGPPLSVEEMAHTGRNWSDAAAQIASSSPLVLSPDVPENMSSWIDGRTYPELFAEAFGTPDVTPIRIAMALATFQRTLYSDRTPFDLDAAGIQPLTLQEQRGRGIFVASSCNVCHAGNQFTDNSFRYIGVRPQIEDLGRFEVTGNPANRGEFRTPGLRNVELRGSYFHNGRFTTLEQVVAFYNRGGDFNAPNKPANLIRPLGLSPQQQADLVAFLKRPLTDPRVAAEALAFDRPMLYTESDRVPVIFGAGKAGSLSVTPTIHAISPPLSGNPTFTVSLANARANASAVLVIDEQDPGITATIPSTASFARTSVVTTASSSGLGWASVSLSLPGSSLLGGKTLFARWYIEDPDASGGFAVTSAARFTIFGPGSSVDLSLSGRIMTPGGQGLKSAVVILTDPLGGSRRVITGSLGYYQFDDIPAVGNYSIRVISKRYRFSDVVVQLSSDLQDVDIVGLE